MNNILKNVGKFLLNFATSAVQSLAQIIAEDIKNGGKVDFSKEQVQGWIKKIKI